jgi:DNA-binding XRE family transcriptional regulator
MRTNLIKSRERLGFNQTKLARLIGVHKSSLCRIESGLTNGHLKTWDKLESMLGVPQKDLRKLDPKRPRAANERKKMRFKPFTVGMRNALLPYLEDKQISFHISIADDGVITHSVLDRWTGEGDFAGDRATARYFPTVFPFIAGRRFVETDETPFVSAERLDFLADLLSRYTDLDDAAILKPSIKVWIKADKTNYHLHAPDHHIGSAHDIYTDDYFDFVGKLKALVKSLTPAVAV